MKVYRNLTPRHRSFRQKIFMAAFLCLTVFLVGTAHATTIETVRIGLHPDKTRVVFELSDESAFQAFVLDNPWRIVIDMPSFIWQAGQISKPSGSYISTIRQGTLEPGISRIVMDMTAPVALQKAFLIKRDGAKPPRLVLDVKKTTDAQFAQEKGKVFGTLKTGTKAATALSEHRAKQSSHQATITPSSPTIVPAQKPAQASSIMPAPIQQTTKKHIIVIDAGHGGVDPGAIGANGIFEKHIALSMAKELKKLLESKGRYQVFLTRDTDNYLRLYQRVAIARQKNADLFISLHADSIGKSNVRGASIYTLSEKASDAQTARLADRENKADIIAGVDISHEDKQVADILIDIAMRDTMNQSKFFANIIIENMKSGQINTLETPHRSAGFAVLKAPDIPSILIEMGFMSNRNEAQLLSQPSYRRNLAQTIMTGIDAYFNQLERNNRI